MTLSNSKKKEKREKEKYLFINIFTFIKGILFKNSLLNNYHTHYEIEINHEILNQSTNILVPNQLNKLFYRTCII